MSGAVRGPSGVAALPPPWLSTASLPVAELPVGSTLVRIHRTVNSPVFYSPGPGRPPAGRFDSASGAFGVVYLAYTFEGAFAETVLRNPARKLVGVGEIVGRSLAVLAPSRSVRLVQMRGAGLQALGVDNSITTGPYGPCSLWADALFGHPDKPDGIAYASRHDPEQVCVALFSRLGLTLEVANDSVPLIEMISDVGAVLRRYGKGLEP